MPSGIYLRTEKSKKRTQKMGLANKGNKYVLGKHWEIKDTSRMNKDKIGKHHSVGTRRKMSEAKMGDKNPMKRLEVRKKISEKMKGRHPKTEFQKGHKMSKDTRNKIGKFQKGRKHPHSEKTKQKNREWHINHPNRKFKDTSIELKIEAELKRRGINYQKQVPLCNITIVDFYLPEYRIVIQCDGDYWHNKQGSKENDERQDKVLTFNGFNIYRFWEHKINKSVKECVDKLFQNNLN